MVVGNRSGDGFEQREEILWNAVDPSVAWDAVIVLSGLS